MKKTVASAFLVLVLCVAFVGFAAAQNPTADWPKSKHADKELAIHEATWEGRQDDAAFCGRCHSEQGFKAWVPQLLKGDPSPIKKPDGSKADEAFIKSLGLTKDQVKPITCAVCHTTPPVLRIQNNIPMLPNGLPVRAVGKGALCMACHNTRNGRIAWDDPDPKRYMQPHDAAQTDVILGKNVYFYNDTGDTASPHAIFTGDSCVTCHKTLGKAGHTFKPADCSACHGQKIKEAFVQNGTTELLKQLAAAIQKNLMAGKDKIACVTSWDPKADKDAPNTAIDGKQIKSIEIPPGIHGQISLKFIMQDGKEVYAQLGNVKDACGDQGKPVYATSDPAVRALWNYLMFTYDGSKGVHNPRFTRNVLLATIGAISK
ncbi:MAG TPA: cytochrome c3 family protein [Syntrophorhabdales bacterium]|nr:cytochrome c3 family protein [Syntrophorhabdales bacterium]